jgi:hypothetical protein
MLNDFSAHDYGSIWSEGKSIGLDRVGRRLGAAGEDRCGLKGGDG